MLFRERLVCRYVRPHPTYNQAVTFAVYETEPRCLSPKSSRQMYSVGTFSRAHGRVSKEWQLRAHIHGAAFEDSDLHILLHAGPVASFNLRIVG